MMDSTVNTGMCRCCASEGAFKDIKSSYHWMGEEEIYSDMLRECFDILLNVSEQGDDGGICEVCITQLRNAINFKKQVLHTEEQFQKHLQNKTLFRPNIVKVEVQAEDDSDDNLGSGDEGFSGNEYEVPIKTEADEPKTRKRAAKATATTTRASAKKAKADATGETSTKHEEEKLTTTTYIKIEPIEEESQIDTLIKAEKVPKPRVKRLLQKHLDNLKLILESTNATMIHKWEDRGYLCCYCPEGFEEPMNLKVHTLTEHQNEEKFYGNIQAKGPARFLVKLDITNLKCMICSANIDSLADIFVHLTEEHDKKFHTDIKDQIFPFKFDTKQLKCCLCTSEVLFSTFRALHEHMHKHYRYFVCNQCDAGFVNHMCLNSHSSIHMTGTFVCRHCPVSFDNVIKRRNHEMRRHTETDKAYLCYICNEGFKEYVTKELHLTKAHGVTPRKYNCTACNRSFTTQSILRAHIRRFHLLEKNYKCAECNRAFFRDGDLKTHMLIHTGAKNHKCEVCSKHYAKRSTLNQHMRIHNNDKRFQCPICDKKFVQRPSLNWHMRAKHEVQSSDASST